MTDFVAADCETLFKLAVEHSPFLRYHEAERFFPILAESWLTLTSHAPWASDPDILEKTLGDVAADPKSRGAALCMAEELAGGMLDHLRVIAGPPVAEDRPLRLGDDPTDPYDIGRAALRGINSRTFLDIGGWLDPSTRRQGDVDYLASLYSELAAAINPDVPWTATDVMDHLPHSWIPQTPNPTVYCEVVWGGSHQELAERLGLPDLAPGDATLSEWVAFTYHYLYAAREPALGETGPRKLEGQWESVTLFFRGGPMRKDRVGVRTMVATEPEFVVISQGVERSLGQHNTLIRAWQDVTHDATGKHPIIYVGLGTHRNFFEPQSGTVWDPTSNPPPGTDPGVHDDDDHTWSGIDELLVWILMLLVIGAWLVAFLASLGPVGVVIAIIVAIILIIVILLLLIAWLISKIKEDDNEDSGDPLPEWGDEEDTGGGTGPQGGSDEPPAPPGSGPDGGPGGGPGGGGPGGGGTFGLPNTGSPTGRAGVSFDVRLVDRLVRAEDMAAPDRTRRPTPYPSPDRCESPYWWDYSGGWGVRVPPSVDNDWESGWQRVDENGRDWAYWASVRLATFLHGGSSGP